jgi:predicted RNA-binding protein with RPS1 domain
MVQPVAHEWADLRPGTTIHGKVSRVEKFGVFVEFGAERPGLIHISELSNEYVKETSDIAKVGDSIDAVVLEVDRKKRQVHLSRKALLGKVEKANEVKEEDESEEEIKTITAMEAAFQKAQSGAQDSPATKSARLKATTEERRRQQEELLSRTLQTAPRK